MCRPPDFTPVAGAGDFEGDAIVGDDSLEWDEDALLEAAVLQAQSSSLLGKRSPLDEARLAEELSRAAKAPRPAVSSAFDSAAVSFMAKMEQSMLHDLQRQQQQRRLAAVSAGANDSILQRALLEQESEARQLQQLRLLNQFQRGNQSQVLPEQQQLLLAQQQLFQQSQAKLRDAFTVPPSSIMAAAALASAVKQEPQWNSSSVLGTAESKIQAWVQKGVGAAAPSPAPLLPKPAAVSSLDAMLAANANPNAALLGFGPNTLPPFQAAALVMDDERKVKRMQSNRASAKRSRQRRQARLEELDQATAQLHEENATMCAKLEEAQEHIHTLEETNRNLKGEVADLRKMLGMTAHSSSNDSSKAESECEVSRLQHSSLHTASSGHGSADSTPAVKVEAGLVELSGDDGIDQLDSFLGLRGTPAGLETLFPQEDVLSELLACLDG